MNGTGSAHGAQQRWFAAQLLGDDIPGRGGRSCTTPYVRRRKWGRRGVRNVDAVAVRLCVARRHLVGISCGGIG